MAIEIKLPDLGDEIDSGDILEVLVSEGDEIRKDQGIIELETDKATVEVPSTHGGKVLKVLVSAGQTIGVGTTLVTLEAAAPVSGEDAPPAETKPAPAPPAEPQAPPEKPAPQPSATAVPPPASPPPPPRSAATPASSTPIAAALATAAAAAETPASAALVPAGPAVRRFAREVGVDLSAVTGTGPGGRIRREDVLEVVRQASRAALDEPETPLPTKPVETPPVTASSPAETDAWGPVQYERLTRIRKTIAARMHQSWSTVPRVTNFDDADVTELEKIRKSSKSDYAAAGIKLTSMPFVIKAVAMALRQHPVINASLDLENKRIIYKQYINVGIAVDTERGLIVPALRNADQLSVADIARHLATISENARTNNFSIEDLRGGTFSISNLGAIGGTYSTPIVNTPEVAILLVGRARKMPVVIDDQIRVRLMMPLSLSYDHRLVDGAAAARFLNEVIRYLGAPGRLLLAP